MWEDKAYHLEGDPLLEVGNTYLLSLDRGLIPEFPNSMAYSIDVPFSRFLVDSDGKLQPVDQTWAFMPAVQALTGLAVDGAAAKIAEAVAEAPAPPQP